MCTAGSQIISLNIIMSCRLFCLSSHSLHTLSENWVASQAVVGATVMSKRLRLRVSVIVKQLHNQRVFLLVISSKNKTSPERSSDYTTAFTAQQCSPWLQCKGFQLFTSSFHHALVCFLLYLLLAGVKATLHWKSNIKAQVQSHNAF